MTLTPISATECNRRIDRKASKHLCKVQIDSTWCVRRGKSLCVFHMPSEILVRFQWSRLLSRYHSVYVYVGSVLGTNIIMAIKLHRINRKVIWRAFKEEKWIKVLYRKSQVNRKPGEIFVTLVIILKCVLNKWFGRVWITLIWLGGGTVRNTVIVIRGCTKYEEFVASQRRKWSPTSSGRTFDLHKGSEHIT